MSKVVAKVWTFESSSSSKTYETLQYTDGTTSCNCPGWTRRTAADGSRTCKHTRLVDQDRADTESLSHKDYGTGEKASAKHTTVSATKSKKKTLIDSDLENLDKNWEKARKIRWK